MEFVANHSQQAPSRGEIDFLLGPTLRHVRTLFMRESVDPWMLWLAASEGLAAWLRHIEQGLSDHLDDRHRARAILTNAYATMVRRRIADLPEPFARELETSSPLEVRAFFEVLAPGPIARSVRWSLAGMTQETPDLKTKARAWQRVQRLDVPSRWVEVSHHLGELAIVLTEQLPNENVPRPMGWLGDVCHAFGKEIAEVFMEMFRLPRTAESAIEVLRMSEYLFRVNPEHSSGIDGDKGTGYIEGSACLWYNRPGWKQVHCGVLGRFQAGIAEVFGRSYSLTTTIPKHGGHTCRITVTPLSLGTNVLRAKPDSARALSAWEPPTSLKGYGSHLERMTKLAEEKNPVEGFIGSETLFWECSRETMNLLGGGRAALMQLAHPAVAHAVRDHSVVHTDMVGRFMRTMTSAYGVVFGSTAEVMDISERVHKIHSAIAGKLDDVPGQPTGRYYALDPEAVYWVGATLLDTIVVIYEQMKRPLEEAEKDRMVQEAGPFWAAFGFPIETCAQSWRDLRSYVRRRCESLAPLVGNSARQQAALLFAPHPALTQPMFNQIRLITAQLLPDSLRSAFHMDLSPQERVLARAWLFAAERMRPLLPPALRYVPPYHQARWRMWRARS